MAGQNLGGGRPGGIDNRSSSAYNQAGGPDQARGGNPNQPQPDLTTTQGRVIENEARARRNDERQARRDAGEENVEVDEPLLELVVERRSREPSNGPDLDGNRPGGLDDGTRGANGAGGTRLEDRSLEAILEALKQDGDVRLKALDAIGAVLTSSGNAREKEKDAKPVGLLSEAPVVPGNPSGLQNNRVDQRLLNVVRLGFHLPLSLCTNDAIDAVRRKPSLLQCKNQHDASGAKISVVDVNAGWPDEHDMSSEEWRDAWTNYLLMLPEVLASEGVERLRAHHDFLVRQPNFTLCFPAILRFDVAVRHNYFWGRACIPFFPGSPEYVAAFMQQQNVVALEAATKSAWRGADTRASASFRAPRVQPYERNDRGWSGDRGWSRDRGWSNEPKRGPPSGGSSQPFRGGKPSASTGPLCLICAKSGHRADRCTSTRLPNNTAVYATSASGRLVAVSSGAELCKSWNASGRIPCQSGQCPGGHTAHVCSFCGTAGHHAGSKRCL